jgi:hypothetical protein
MELRCPRCGDRVAVPEPVHALRIRTDQVDVDDVQLHRCYLRQRAAEVRARAAELRKQARHLTAH